MRKIGLAWTLSLIFGFLCVVIAQRAAAQGTSTPEERARWAEITHKLESSPLDESVSKDGESALNRFSNAHDIHVPLCPALLGEFNDAKYKYRHEITRQYMLASGRSLSRIPTRNQGETRGQTERFLPAAGPFDFGRGPGLELTPNTRQRTCNAIVSEGVVLLYLFLSRSLPLAPQPVQSTVLNFSLDK